MAKEPCPCLERAKRGVAMAQTFGRARVMPDKTIVYPKKGVEPPPDLDGYKRDPGNKWRFIPLWGACEYRYQNQFLKACGAIGILSICTHPDGPKENKREVNLKTCEQCPLSKVK